MGATRRPRKARNELPQPRPRAWDIFGPARGIVAAIAERRMAFAAMPEAAYRVNTSTVYGCMPM